MSKEIKGKPFIKWVGGKSNLSNFLIENLPKKYNDYYEPFLGGGALFFKLQPRKAFLSDINLDLILTYIAVRDEVELLIRQLLLLQELHSKEQFLKIRELDSSKAPLIAATRFIYLNKTCFNGLYRVNKAGKFNVPMGNYKKPRIGDSETLRNAHKLLQGINITCNNFNQIKPKKGDFVYLDPPYDENYDSYSPNGFGSKKQKELASFCQELDKKGCYFMMSNSNTNNIRDLYKDYNIIEVDNIRSVSCKSDGRGKTKELLIKNY